MARVVKLTPRALLDEPVQHVDGLLVLPGNDRGPDAGEAGRGHGREDDGGDRQRYDELDQGEAVRLLRRRSRLRIAEITACSFGPRPCRPIDF